jgi:acyl-coenzyme A synthetase/AMP-(fatty) acid ligase
MRRLRIFGDRSVSDTVAWRNGSTTVSVRQLQADVAALIERLPPGRYVFNLAGDRYAFIVGFLAVVAAGRICLMPPNKAPTTLARLRDQYPDAVAIGDTEFAPGELHPMRIGVGTPGGSFALPDVRDDAVVAIMFTSGSTGEPTPHPKTWGSLTRGARSLQQRLARHGIAPRSVVGTVPPQHMYGFETTVMLPLHAGWPVHSACPLLPADLREAHAAVRGPTLLATTPLHLRAIVLDHLELADIACTISSTMPLARDLAHRVERLLAALLVEIYGSTETGAVATRRTALEDVWRPLDGVRLRLDGAAWCEGGHVDQPVRLADRLRLAADNGFVLDGRTGDIVKIAGKRASLTALNSTLIAVPGVLDGVFFDPSEHGTGQARLAAIVVAPELDDQTIVACLAEHIDAAFLPRPLYRVAALPREASGKLRLDRLRDLVAQLHSSNAESGPC